MGRRRWIDTEGLYFDAKLVRVLGAEGLHVYIRLWSLADDFGGYEVDADHISLQTGALRISPEEVNKYLSSLISLRRVVPYQAEGKSFHWIRHFLRYNHESRPRLPSLPLPPWMSHEIKKQGPRRFAVF